MKHLDICQIHVDFVKLTRNGSSPAFVRVSFKFRIFVVDITSYGGRMDSSD